MQSKDVKRALRKHAKKEKAAFLPKFFKTGEGEYGEGDKFIGVMVPDIRNVARQYADMGFSEIKRLLKSSVHEERLCAAIILVIKYELAKKNNELDAQEYIYQFYLKNKEGINNWDIVDLSAPRIVGRHLIDKDKKDIYMLAASKRLWDRRIATVSTLTFIKEGQFSDALSIIEILINDKEDLMHKACGWMLREIGKKDRAAEDEFLKKHYKNMPRTMLRYAIERHPHKLRKDYLA